MNLALVLWQLWAVASLLAPPLLPISQSPLRPPRLAESAHVVGPLDLAE